MSSYIDKHNDRKVAFEVSHDKRIKLIREQLIGLKGVIDALYEKPKDEKYNPLWVRLNNVHDIIKSQVIDIAFNVDKPKMEIEANNKDGEM